MTKKVQGESSVNNTTMSREDRKIEQTIRIMEKAEERRLKREEKKRQAMINKTNGGSKPSGASGPSAQGQRKLGKSL